MEKLAAIALGGALGALARFALGGLVQRAAGPDLPLGTLAVNVLGCFAMGLAGTLIASRAPLREEVPALLLVGLLGAFTTFSTYGWETVQLARGGLLGRAALHVLASNALGLAGVWAGIAVAGLWTRSA